MKKEATMILVSKNIFTAMEQKPEEGAVILCGNRIEAVIDAAEIDEWKGRDTVVYEMGEQLICPGFVDNHVFFTGYVWSHIGADLSSADTKKEAAEILEAYAKKMPNGRSVLGHGLPGEVLETAEDTEEVLKAFGKTPVVGFTADRDGCIMNQAAKDRFGFDGSEVYAEICYKVFDEYLRDEDFIRSEYEAFSALLAKQGVTSIKEIGFDQYSGFTSVLKNLENEKQLRHRVNLVSQPVGAPMDYEYGKKCMDEFQSDFIQFMGFNVMVDGEIAAGNAELVDEYKNNPGSHGEQAVDYEGLYEAVVKADALGMRCALHAEGDGAVRKTVDIYERCREENGVRDSRHVITDLEMVRPEDLKRMARLGITACNYVQIMECLGDFEDFYGYDCVGEEGLKNYWPYKRMVENQVHLCCGTDLPLTVPDIPLSVYLTVNRTFPDGKPEGGINKECALTVDEILKAWTIEGQYANFKERVLGTLEAGKLADIAVIDKNLFAVEPEKLAEAKVSMTICDGKVVYCAQEI